MDCIRLVVFLSLLLSENIFAEITPVEPKCFDPGVRVRKCCTAYRTIGGKCYPCLGAYGKECNKPCQPGYYGLKCVEKCHCERCNATTGECFYKSTASACVGYNCTIVCPTGRYGRGCMEKCMCQSCDSITGICNQRLTIGISLASKAVFLAAGILFVAALVIFLLVKRSSRKLSSNSDNNYVPSWNPGDSATQNYARVEENVYHECEPLSLHNNDSTNSNSESHYDKCNIPESLLRKKAKPSILSILMSTNECSEINLTNRGYIQVIDMQKHGTESSGSGQEPQLQPPQQLATTEAPLPLPPTPQQPPPQLAVTEGAEEPSTPPQCKQQRQPQPTAKESPSPLQYKHPRQPKPSAEAPSLPSKTSREPSPTIKQMIDLFETKRKF